MAARRPQTSYGARSRTTAKTDEESAPSNEASSLAAQAGMTILLNPLNYGKVLIQLGYEPIKPFKRHTISSLFGFGAKKYAYPSVFALCGVIRQRDGYWGLWTTGLAANVLHTVVQSHFNEHALAHLRKWSKNEKPESEIAAFFVETSHLMMARAIADVISQPFFVLMVRQMGSFADPKATYLSLPQSVSLIWREEGFKGFFSGLVPRLLGDVATILLTQLVARLIGFLMDRLAAHERGQEFDAENKAPSKSTLSIASLAANAVTYPFSVVAAVMCIDSTKMKLATRFGNWYLCWKDFNKTGEAKRGTSLFLRFLTPHQLKRHALTN